MNNIILIVFALIFTSIITPIISIIVGMAMGCVTETLFPFIHGMFTGTFLENYSMLQIGGFFGFIGSFFDTRSSGGNNEKTNR